MNLYTTLF